MLSDQRKGVGRKHRAAEQAVLPLPKQQTIIKDRLIEAAGLICSDAPDVAYQHTILCQTSLPYRDPGPDVRRWERQQGNAALLINAGEARDPSTGQWVQLGLPWGPKARLVLLHLNSEAIRTQSPLVDVGESLTAHTSQYQKSGRGAVGGTHSNGLRWVERCLPV